MELPPEEQLDEFDLVLALMYALRGKRRITKTHIQKALYIASKHIERIGEILEFVPYRMGPWSEEVNDALEKLSVNGDIVVSKNSIVLSEQGLSKAERAWRSLSDRERNALSNIADFVGNLTSDELCLYVYKVYGDVEKSDIARSLLNRRKELASSMYMKGAVSIELAAKISGLPITEFVKYLKEKGIKPFSAVEEDLDIAEKL